MQFIIETILREIFEIIILTTGSYIRWNLKGRRGTFAASRNPNFTDIFIGLVFWLSLIGLVIYLISIFKS